MRLEIRGGYPLAGEVTIDGSKHAVLPILGACLLTEDEVILSNVPSILDVDYLISWIRRLGVKVSREGNRVTVNPTYVASGKLCLPAYFTSRLHSAYVLWPGLALRLGEFRSGFPGGCRIGKRPVTEILEILEAFGIETNVTQGGISFRTHRLKSPKRLYLHRYSSKALPSVTKTALLMAARLNDVTEIVGAFARPEIVDLILFLKELGAEIDELGNRALRVRGRNYLGNARFEIRPDPIEAASYAAMAIATRGRVSLKRILTDDLQVEIEYFQKMGVIVEYDSRSLTIDGSQDILPISVPFTHAPGLCTDTIPCLVSALATAKGISYIKETVWEDRFAYIQELRKMGANIQVEGTQLTIYGVERLHGTEVSGKDLRGTAALITAGLAASGRTCVKNAHHVMRGYSDIVGKLAALGADIVVSGEEENEGNKESTISIRHERGSGLSEARSE